MTDFQIKRQGNKVILKNISDKNLVIQIQKACTNDNSEFFVNEVSTAPETREYTFTEDATYNVDIVGIQDEVHAVIPFYDNILYNIIDSMELLYCNCDCHNCENCYDEDLLMETFVKVMTFYSLTKKYYEAYISIAMECLQCEFTEEINCIYLNELILGNHENSFFIKKLIMTYFLSFYYAELNGENSEEIDNKFKIKKITKCFKPFDYICIKDKIDNMATFSINSGAYINQPPSAVGDFSTTIDNRTTETLTSAMFTTGTTPPYSDPEGDVADAVRIDTLPSLGILIYDSTNVTVGQIISIADIELGLLVYESPKQDTIANDSFTFSVRDVGSLQFTS